MIKLGEIVLVGLGLHDEMGVSLRGLEEIRTADAVFVELYTSLLSSFSLDRLERISGKRPVVLSRKDLEEKNAEAVLKAAGEGTTVLLVPGDSLIATTHVALRLEAEKHGIRTRIVHAASIISAAIGLSGLHNYKFGRSVTIPFPENFSETPYEVVAQNRKLGLHTLCLLDIKMEENRCLSISEGLELLLKIETKRREKATTMNTLAVGIARAGSHDPTVKAGSVSELLRYDFGEPPQCLIFPGNLHFMEAEALIAFAGAPKTLQETAK